MKVSRPSVELVNLCLNEATRLFASPPPPPPPFALTTLPSHVHAGIFGSQTLGGKNILNDRRLTKRSSEWPTSLEKQRACEVATKGGNRNGTWPPQNAHLRVCLAPELSCLQAEGKKSRAVSTSIFLNCTKRSSLLWNPSECFERNSWFFPPLIAPLILQLIEKSHPQVNRK